MASSLGHEFVTMRLEGQLLGIPVLAVQDVLSAQKITSIPLAPGWVAGVLNLRGRIVTAINMRERMGFGPRANGGKDMSIVVEFHGEPYSLQIDRVGDVLNLENETMEKNPVTMDQRWREVSRGIYRLDGELLAILDVERVLGSAEGAVAA
ncbi:chemotaxis protein CheW [Iodidimonas gelatinilytica]|uniref:Chemotaxis protein CheW n=2 Tax=Iodidimonas TaxID=2066486 RepID=A0A5A7MPM8_9PROT|nr:MULTISPECIES: chemotaxis protein CheW [Iodidimonas]GEQ97911.1 chemotaxis protein CheW [Iodidimonas gelatinilytica]GEQ99967.1 chemotaxis protein CheW [Iodidimonas gelatinilytica]GER07511.1 chemotaxis protein CheW [Kordiimonadales bacterium JCM 17843]GGO14197.1 chemotaxis protein CheW [Iodidimonas muriae]